jgi:hypothetical protein
VVISREVGWRWCLVKHEYFCSRNGRDHGRATGSGCRRRDKGRCAKAETAALVFSTGCPSPPLHRLKADGTGHTMSMLSLDARRPGALHLRKNTGAARPKSALGLLAVDNRSWPPACTPATGPHTFWDCACTPPPPRVPCARPIAWAEYAQAWTGPPRRQGHHRYGIRLAWRQPGGHGQRRGAAAAP